METKLNFNSAICTTREQSERLLALGLKKETADMFWWDNGYGSCAVISRPAEKEDGEYGKVIPAWSLHRLIEMIQDVCSRIIMVESWVRIENRCMPFVDYHCDSFDNTYDNLCDCIEWLIKGGYFNKEYLEE